MPGTPPGSREEVKAVLRYRADRGLAAGASGGKDVARDAFHVVSGANGAIAFCSMDRIEVIVRIGIVETIEGGQARGDRFLH